MKINFITSSELENNEKVKLDRLWANKGYSIVEFIEKELKVKFKNDSYDCILNENLKIGGISNPLTIRVVGKGLIEFLTLIHELIHIIMVENNEYFNEKFKDLEEKPINISHAIIFYLLDKIESKFFSDIDFSKRKEIDKKNYPIAFELKEKINLISNS